MKPMVPDAKERAIQWPHRSTYGLPLEGAIELQDRAYRDGFAACLALLRQGKRSTVEAGCRAHSPRLWKEIDDRAEGHPSWSYAAQEAEINAGTRFLRAAADAIDSGEGA